MIVVVVVVVILAVFAVLGVLLIIGSAPDETERTIEDREQIEYLKKWKESK